MVLRIKKRFEELTFWHYQLLGFTLFAVNDILRSWEFWFSSAGAVAYMIYSYSVFFGLTLLLRYIYRPFYSQKKTQLFYLVLVLVTSLLCSTISFELRLIFRYPLTGTGENWFRFKRDFEYLIAIFTSTWVFFVWSILYFSIRYWGDLNREYERSKASQLLASKAQLQMLRYQINPHFLFNTLASIKALTYENPEQAGNMLTELSDFLRATLIHKDSLFINISQEVEILEQYLAIEKMRFEERLAYMINVDNDVANCKILCFITQPLVENAIRHGFKSRPAGMKLTINFYNSGDKIKIEIINSGSLVTGSDSTHTGIKNIVDRLENAYLKDYTFTLTEAGGYVRAELQIPCSK